MDFEAVKKVLAALEREDVLYVVFGAVAINLLGLPRATEALDIFVSPEAENIERLRTALRSVFPDDSSINEITSEDLLGDYPAVQYVPPEGTFYVDILTRLGEASRYEDITSQRLDFDGLAVNVATPAILYRMKKDTVRPKDWGEPRRSDVDSSWKTSDAGPKVSQPAGYGGFFVAVAGRSVVAGCHRSGLEFRRPYLRAPFPAWCAQASRHRGSTGTS